jgi:hypothetical protein
MHIPAQVSPFLLQAITLIVVVEFHERQVDSAGQRQDFEQVAILVTYGRPRTISA